MTDKFPENPEGTNVLVGHFPTYVSYDGTLPHTRDETVKQSYNFHDHGRNLTIELTVFEQAIMLDIKNSAGCHIILMKDNGQLEISMIDYQTCEQTKQFPDPDSKIAADNRLVLAQYIRNLNACGFISKPCHKILFEWTQDNTPHQALRH